MVDEALVAQELDRVYDLYGAQLRAFHRALYGLLVAGLTVFALIVVPFLGLSIRVDALQGRQAELAAQQVAADAARYEAERAGEQLRRYLDEIASFSQLREWEENEGMIDTARARQEAVSGLRDSYRDDPDPAMRDWALGNRPVPPEDSRLWTAPRQAGFDNACEFRLNGPKEGITDYVACRMCDAFREQSRSMQSLISRLPDEIVDAADAGSETPEGLARRACGWLIGGEIHWYKGEPRPAEAEALRGFFTWDLKAYEDATQGYYRALSDRNAEIEAQISALSAQVAAAREISASVTEQLDHIAKFDQLATPVGNVPVTLLQIVLLFPPALAAGFLIVANSFGRLASLRQALFRLFARRDAAAEVADRTHIQVIAPLWLDRQDGVMALVMKWVVLLLPLVLMLASFYLVWRAGTLAAQPYPPGSPISSAGYLAIYGLSVVLVLAGLAHISVSVSRGGSSV